MGVAQRLLGFVLCVVQPVAGQIDGFVAVRSHRHSLAAAPPPALVDVVAQMDDQIEVFVAHVLVCGVEARTPRLTGGEREPHPRGGLPPEPGPCGSGPPQRSPNRHEIGRSTSERAPNRGSPGARCGRVRASRPPYRASPPAGSSRHARLRIRRSPDPTPCRRARRGQADPVPGGSTGRHHRVSDLPMPHRVRTGHLLATAAPATGRYSPPTYPPAPQPIRPHLPATTADGTGAYTTVYPGCDRRARRGRWDDPQGCGHHLHPESESTRDGDGTGRR